MDNSPIPNKYVSINRVTSSVELNLPEQYQQYADDLRAEIVRKFSFANLNHHLENQIQEFIEEYLQNKDQKL